MITVRYDGFEGIANQQDAIPLELSDACHQPIVFVFHSCPSMNPICYIVRLHQQSTTAGFCVHEANRTIPCETTIQLTLAISVIINSSSRCM